MSTTAAHRAVTTAAKARRVVHATMTMRQGARGARLGSRNAELNGTIQSVVRAFGILRAIAESRDGIGLGEISLRVGMHGSTVSHLVKTMVTLGYVQQDGTNKRYRVGCRLFELAAGALDTVELVNVATRHLQNVSVVTGETSHLAVPRGGDCIIIAKAEGAGMFQLSESVGSERPGYCTALGKVLLGALSPGQLDLYFRTHEFHAFTPSTITSVRRLRTVIDEVCRTGIAFDDAEYRTELRCAAVPVRDFTGRVRCSIGVSGPVWRLARHDLRRLAGPLREAADALSSDLGYIRPAGQARRHGKGIAVRREPSRQHRE